MFNAYVFTYCWTINSAKVKNSPAGSKPYLYQPAATDLSVSTRVPFAEG